MKLIVLLIAALSCGACLVGSSELDQRIPLTLTEEKKERKAPEFSLSDQFKKRAQHSFPKDKWSVFFVAGRKGSDQIKDWATAIHERYGEEVEQVGIADVSGVPGPMQGLIRAVFRNTLDYPVLMDWEGNVSKKWGYEAGKVRVFVVSPEGNITFTVDGEINEENKARLFELLPKLEIEVEN
jgi:hypothetical protein